MCRVAEQAEGKEMQPAASTLLLGHFCSIITSLALTPDQRGLVSTDRDHKVRVSHLSPHPLAVRASAVLLCPLRAWTV